jgi:hypothetical protein
MIVLTKAQRKALFQVFKRDFPNWESPFQRKGIHGETVRVASYRYREFRKRVQPAFGGDCVMLPWAGMWLGIEKDGYTHS